MALKWVVCTRCTEDSPTLGHSANPVRETHTTEAATEAATKLPHQCSQCNRRFPTLKLLQRHLLQAHVSCSRCKSIIIDNPMQKRFQICQEEAEPARKKPKLAVVCPPVVDYGPELQFTSGESSSTTESSGPHSSPVHVEDGRQTPASAVSTTSAKMAASFSTDISPLDLNWSTTKSQRSLPHNADDWQPVEPMRRDSAVELVTTALEVADVEDLET